jgi:hypothetical protein
MRIVRNVPGSADSVYQVFHSCAPRARRRPDHRKKISQRKLEFSEQSKDISYFEIFFARANIGRRNQILPRLQSDAGCDVLLYSRETKTCGFNFASYTTEAGKNFFLGHLQL